MKLASSEWCSSCQPVKKYIEENNLDVEVLDIDTNMEEAQKAGVRGIPALIEGGKVSVVGAENIMNKLKEEELWD